MARLILQALFPAGDTVLHNYFCSQKRAFHGYAEYQTEPTYGGRGYLEKQDFIIEKQKDTISVQKDILSENEQAIEEQAKKIQKAENTLSQRVKVIEKQDKIIAEKNAAIMEKPGLGSGTPNSSSAFSCWGHSSP